MIIDSNASKQLWPLGFLWLIQLKNRSPTRAIPDITPFQALTREIPDLAYLLIFKCRAYVFIPKEKRIQSAKLDPRSEQCIFVGYDGSGIHCLWNRHRVIRSKDVIFDERLTQLLEHGAIIPPEVLLASLIVPSNVSIVSQESLPALSQNIADSI